LVWPRHYYLPVHVGTQEEVFVMENQKILLNQRELIAINTQAAMDLLTLCLEVIRRIHPAHENMVLMGGTSWWVVTETAADTIDLTAATIESPETLIAKIREVRSGLLIVRQMEHNRITLYFITDLDALTQQLHNSCLNWSEIEKLQIFSDSCAQSETGECIGFDMIKARGRDQDRVLISPT